MIAPCSSRDPARPLRIACVLTTRRLSGEVVSAMSVIRYVRIAEALARRGHEVDLVLGDPARLPVDPAVGIVIAGDVRWGAYDVVKTCLHSGFAALSAWGGDDHPWIVSNLGSVVASTDVPGVHFYGAVREALWQVQQRVAARSRHVSLLTRRNADLWRRMHGDAVDVILVPTGVDAHVPPPGIDPYPRLGIERPVALYAGNLYSLDRQAEVNRFWQERLNRLGRALLAHGLQLVVLGPGATDRLDGNVVRHLGPVDFRELWNWQWHASVGIVLAQGALQDNESSKIYYYLRTGLPVACEAPVPNASLVALTGHGAVVEFDAGDLTALAEAAAALARRPPPVADLIARMVAEHSWDVRTAAYGPMLAAARQRSGTAGAIPLPSPA